MSCYEFGRALVETNDLDPVYVVLWEAGLTAAELRRFLLAYWCFYHVGTAAWIAQDRYAGSTYWDRMRTAAGSKDYPRCPERRHFRGENARKSVEWLAGRGLTELFAPFRPAASYRAGEVVDVVRGWVGFGPWIAFKVADMVERLGLCRVTFDLDTAMYDAPREAAAMLYEAEKGVKDVHGESGRWAVESILLSPELSRKGAPPRYERRLNVQEAETILCKWKSYMNGRYHIGEDVAAVRRGLLRFAKVPIAQRLIQAGKKGGLW